MDHIKLAQRIISMLSSMIESGECHTTTSREMVNNAQNGLEQLRQHFVSGQMSVEKCNSCGSKKVELIHRCKCGVEW